MALSGSTISGLCLGMMYTPSSTQYKSMSHEQRTFFIRNQYHATAPDRNSALDRDWTQAIASTVKSTLHRLIYDLVFRKTLK